MDAITRSIALADLAALELRLSRLGKVSRVVMRLDDGTYLRSDCGLRKGSLAAATAMTKATARALVRTLGFSASGIVVERDALRAEIASLKSSLR